MSIDALPNELLALVASRLSEPIIFEIPASRTSNAVTFSQVCARWRGVALSLGHLWTNYVLHLRAGVAYTREQTDWLQWRLSKYAALAKRRSVGLTVIQDENAPANVVVLLANLLVTHPYTLLTLDVPDVSFVALASLAFSFPALNRLSITLRLGSEGNQALLPRGRSSPFFANMPCLQHLKLGYHASEWRPTDPIIPQLDEWALPLAGLRSFSMPHIWLELFDLVEILEAAPELHTCTAFLDAPCFEEDLLEDIEIAPRLPNLRNLSLVLRLEYPDLFVEYLDTLELDRLELCIVEDSEEGDEACFGTNYAEQYITETELHVSPLLERLLAQFLPQPVMAAA
ncbi:hypothetical protein MKEN_00908700 [Mycena kentingensis (nom. inval.)]|nr:hypothetical protein MKEN_00908700 [Mycena kentingensis (nom. inval.)]